MVIYCRSCDGPNTFPRNWINDSDKCKFCGTSGQWRTLNEPKHAYELNHNDRRLLAVFRIAAD